MDIFAALRTAVLDLGDENDYSVGSSAMHYSTHSKHTLDYDNAVITRSGERVLVSVPCDCGGETKNYYHPSDLLVYLLNK